MRDGLFEKFKLLDAQVGAQGRHARDVPARFREARDQAKGSGDSIGDNLDDAWIHTKIRTKLLGEGEFPGGSVNVDVKNNVVTLRGHVKSKEDRAKAEDIAKRTDGVKSVKNLLTIKTN